MYNGLNNQNLRVETLQEFQLKTAGYEAEFGGAMGGVLSIRTKSGSNDFHGSVLWYGSGSALTGVPSKRLRLDPAQSADVAEYVFDAEDDEAINEYGFTLGGSDLARPASGSSGRSCPRSETGRAPSPSHPEKRAISDGRTGCAARPPRSTSSPRTK